MAVDNRDFTLLTSYHGLLSLRVDSCVSGLPYGPSFGQSYLLHHLELLLKKVIDTPVDEVAKSRMLVSLFFQHWFCFASTFLGLQHDLELVK